jgi:hypothetical protein
MLSENFLLETFSAKGNDLKELKSLVDEITQKTHLVRLDSRDLVPLSYICENEGRMEFYSLDPENLYVDTDKNLENHRQYLAKKKVLEKGDFDPLLEELQNSTKLFIHDKVCKKTYFTSFNIMDTMDRFGVNGPFLLEPNVVRDTVIAQRFGKGIPCTLVTKEFKGIKKVFSILSGKYTLVDQKFIFDVIENLETSGELGAPKCKEWEVTHFLTSVLVEFPEKAEELRTHYGMKEKFIPGIWIGTSDTGDSSVKVRGTWRYGSSLLFSDEVRRKHIGNIDCNDILKEVRTHIFDKYTVLPEALCDLMMKDITTPTSTENAEKIKNVFKSVFKQLGFVKIIGRKNVDNLLKILEDEFDETIAYTAYDLALAVMTLPERVKLGTNESTFRKACGQAAYADYTLKETIEINFI